MATKERQTKHVVNAYNTETPVTTESFDLTSLWPTVIQPFYANRRCIYNHYLEYI